MKPSTNPRPRTNRSLTVALYVNAALIAGLILAVMGRDRAASPFESIALGQPAPMPIAGGAGFYLMPAQFDSTHWGCYVMDVDAQTLVAYQYNPRGSNGRPSLQLLAARSFVHDRQLKSFNTEPKPDEIRILVDNEKQGLTGDAVAPPPADGGDPTSRPVVPNSD